MKSLTHTAKAIIDTGMERCDPVEAYRKIFSMIDLTSLEGTDSPTGIEQLCAEAVSMRVAGNDGDTSWYCVASVCVYPLYAGLVSGLLSGTGILTTCVAGGFPSGQIPLHLRLAELEYCLDEGADEIDMVISRGRMLGGEQEYIREEIRAFSGVCKGRALLKVILETGELREEGLIRGASRIALEEGADFIKTSTGKISPGATYEAFYIMLEEINRFYEDTGKMRGIKAAGGVADPETALGYFLLAKSVLGENWLKKDLLRFGASRLARNIFHLISQP